MVHRLRDGQAVIPRRQMDEVVKAIMGATSDYDLNIMYLEVSYETGTISVRVEA